MASANNEKDILTFIVEHPRVSSTEIEQGLKSMALATIKRGLKRLVTDNLILAEGKGKATRYLVSPVYELTKPIDVAEYFTKEIDERIIKTGFNHELISTILANTTIFTRDENEKLQKLQSLYIKKSSQLTPFEYKKELERLAIDLSWKSSQIEGNTYSLLETERLLKDKETAAGKPKDDATMLLNHKEAIDFIIEQPKYVSPLTVPAIEDIHSILMKDLNVDRNMRTHRVAISGTNYKPLDNQFQIKEALENMCELVNKQENVFSKAFLVLTLISYIQACADGNKRTARIISNAALISNGYCPISFRTIDSVEYKKAMLIFYEQNNIRPFKEIFINQFEFAVNTYF
jgi:predicted transcriptional regulator/fido (protein-threonine AMPylation protein)